MVLEFVLRFVHLIRKFYVDRVKMKWERDADILLGWIRSTLEPLDGFTPTSLPGHSRKFIFISYFRVSLYV